MREYQSNSNKAKQEAASNATEERRINKVVTGKVTTKANKARKFTDIFISEDATNVKSYIVMDVLVPAIKKAISDIVTDGIDMILYGGSGGKNKNRTGNKVSYRSYYDDRRDDRRDGSNMRNRFDYDDIIFGSRNEAENVRLEMIDTIERYGVVTVSDMYEMADLPTVHTGNKYGWTNIRNAETVRVRDGYIIKLPKAMPID